VCWIYFGGQREQAKNFVTREPRRDQPEQSLAVTREVSTDGRPPAKFDHDRIQAAVTELLCALGEDPSREGLIGTPRRVADMYEEIFAGIREEPGDLLQVTFDEQHEEMILVRDIPFYSVCEHHLLPFHGEAHVGYIPHGRVVGISKLARVVDCLARRPQVQERLTSQIADLIQERLAPRGVAVVVKAQHLCMTMRGIRKPGSKVVTSAHRGVFLRSEPTRLEFLSLLDGAG
jgi:GTP cyclohydrolase IA